MIVQLLGPLALLITYTISLFLGSYFGLFIHKKEPYYSAVGASGAVTGVLYGAIYLMPEMRLGILFIPIPLPAYVVGLGYMIYTIYGMKKRTGNIGHSAHFGGAIGGLLMAIFTGYIVKRKIVMDELRFGPIKFNLWLILIKYISPIAVTLIFVHGFF